MPQEESRLLYNQIRSAQDKYVYFLLAVAASAIAFTMQITKGSIFSLTLTPLGLAVLFWSLSFYCGCRNICYNNSNMLANFSLLQVESGNHPQAGNNTYYIEAASEGIRDRMSENQTKIIRYGSWQFRFIILGGVAFVIWHLFEMAVRTIGN
jgi:hypothetical protein